MNRQEAKQRAKMKGVRRETYDAAVVKTYHRHDLKGTNQESRRAFLANPPALDVEQQRCVVGLFREGIAITSFASLVGDDDLWSRLVDDSAAFAAVGPSKLAPVDHAGESVGTADLQTALEAALKRGKVEKAEKARARLAKIAGGGTRTDTFVARQFADDPSAVIGTPWLEFATSLRMLDVINSFLRMYAKVRYIDQWYTAVTAPDAERIASQRVPVDSRVTVTGPAGTLVLVNTNGFHRGGFATESDRVMVILTYCSPAALESIIEKGFQVDVDTLPPDTPDSVRRALA